LALRAHLKEFEAFLREEGESVASKFFLEGNRKRMNYADFINRGVTYW
jgi:hypothetical protein